MRKLLKGLLGLTLAASSTAALVSCKDKKKEYKHGELKVSMPVGNIRVSFDILADKLGYFDEEEVGFTAVNLSGNDALTAIEAENDTLDILTAGFVADLQHIGQGRELTFIAGTAVEGGALIAKRGQAAQYKDSNTIINFDKFRTSKFGLARNEASWIVTRQYLKDNDPQFQDTIDAEDSDLITYYADAQTTAQAVGRGEVKIGYLPLEYALLYQDGYDLEIIAAAGELQPEYVCCREVTAKNTYEKKYEAFVAYERARIRAWEFYANEANQNRVVDIVSDYSGKEKDYVRTYLYGGVTNFSTDPNSKGIEAYVTAALNAGVLKQNVDVSGNISTGAYKEALDSLIAENPTNAFYQKTLALYNQYNTKNNK